MRTAVCIGSATLLFFAACGLAFVHPFGNPRSVPTEPRWALLKDATMPEQAKAILRSKCADCHSEATHWPIYSRVAPMSWLVERDVVEGRQHMNLSQWQSLSLDRRQALAQEILHEVRLRAMPPMQYRLWHWGAALTSASLSVLVTLVPDGQAGSAAAEPGDAVRGDSVFTRRCTGCHAIDANREGPHLRGVYGRKAGSVSGFNYSQALKNLGRTWDENSLETWLRDTDAAVPGSAMGFSVPKPQDRADIIAFLKSLR
ncbi:MAG: heme-binding domain-containing protein [Terracidiphilus sp.]